MWVMGRKDNPLVLRFGAVPHISFHGWEKQIF
jgi:hypothetical protein